MPKLIDRLRNLLGGGSIGTSRSPESGHSKVLYKEEFESKTDALSRCGRLRRKLRDAGFKIISEERGSVKGKVYTVWLMLGTGGIVRLYVNKSDETIDLPMWVNGSLYLGPYSVALVTEGFE